jgi:hypothetical protein
MPRVVSKMGVKSSGKVRQRLRFFIVLIVRFPHKEPTTVPNHSGVHFTLILLLHGCDITVRSFTMFVADVPKLSVKSPDENARRALLLTVGN